MSKVLITRSKLDNLAVAVSAKSGATLPLTIAQMQTAVEGIQPGGTDYVVTLSKDSQDNWHTDRTFSEIQTAYNGGKNIVVVADISSDVIADGYFYDDGGGSAGFASLIAEYSYDYSAHESTVEYTQYEMYSDGTDYQYARDFYHTFDGNASASDVLSGKIFYNASGRQVGTGSGGTPTLQTKSVSYTPSESQQTATVTADSGYDGLDEVNVTVGAVSSTYVGSGITRRSSSDLTASGATVSVPSGYYSSNASKAVASGSATTPATTVTANPSISVSSSGLITATASATKSVTPTVSAGYVSSGTAGTITVSGSNTSQLTTQGATTITPSTSSQTAVASGVYTTGAVTVAAMPSGTAGTPTATKGSVSNHSVSVTPSVTNTTGYITGSTKTGTAVTVTASELVSGTKSITENGTGIDVTNYASVDVAVQGGGTYSLSNIVPTQTIATTTSNMYGYVGLIPSYTAYVQSGEWYLVTYDNTEYVCTGYYGANSEIMAGDYQLLTTDVPWVETPFLVEHNLTNGYFFLGSRVSGNHTLKVDKIEFIDDGVTLIGKTITANGTYNASTDSADGYDTVTVNVPSSSPNLQAKTNISPTTSSQTITADSGYDGLSSVQINAMPSMTLPTAASASSSGTSKATITPGSSAQYLNIPTGYNAAAAYYTIAASGGGGLTLLKTTSLGTLQTSSTSASDTGKTMTVTGYNDYDVLIVDASVDSPVNGRHTSTVSFILVTGTSSVDTKNTYTVAGNKWNSKLSSSGTGSTRQSTSAYGIYVNAATVSGSTMTLAFYQRYNSNSTGTLNGTYTARVYGLKLYELIGG